MNDKGGIEPDDSIVALLRQRLPDLLAVYVFGSAATSAMRADSDIDLAFWTGRSENTVMVWNLAQSIAGIVGRDVDLIDLSAASTVMKARIVCDGTRLFCADMPQCASFEAHALADYARLNEERRGILADIAIRGSVHAG